MWNNAWSCKVLFLAIFSIDTLGLRINKQLTREQIYLDVLKNITGVDQILYKLLSNYKELKDLYEAQAKPKDELSLEIGSDEEEEHAGQKQNKTDFENDSNFHQVTQMIFDEEVLEESSDKSNENNNVKEHLQPQFADNIIDVDNEQEFVKKPKKKNIDLTRTDLLPRNTESHIMPRIHLSHKPELVIVGAPLKYPQDRPKTKNVKLKNNGIGFRPFRKVDLDFSKQSLRAGYNNIPEDLNEIRKWWSPNEFSLEQGLSKTDNSNQLNTNTILVLVVNKQQMDLLLKNNEYVSDYEKKDEEMFRTEQLERKILRDAYGNACLKVAVRKCYKTLMDVRKLICTMDFKCRDSFKGSFKTYSKRGCIAEFDYKGNREELTKKNRENWKRNDKKRKPGKKRRPVKMRRPIDPSRIGPDVNYYELCLPVMMSDETNTDSKIISEPPGKFNKIQPINVLRDRYERECQRLSTEKCMRACKYAVTNTCKDNKCERYDRKKFKRTCKKECKYSFRGKSDDSDDDEDLDSDDSDDDDSDEDYSDDDYSNNDYSNDDYSEDDVDSNIFEK